MSTLSSAPLIRIGELAARTGVSTHVLRVWEERYAVVRPRRSPGGYRLYDERDEERVRAMVRLREAGVSTAEAAEQVGRGASEVDLPGTLARITAGFAAYDLGAVRVALDEALDGHTVEDVLNEVCFPYLRWLGDEWEAGRISVAQEHHASGTLREWLTTLSRDDVLPAPRDSEGRSRPSAVLACTPHERHDIGLLGLDLVLRRAGWRVVFLGADTPVEDAVSTTLDASADVLVLAGTEPHMFRAHLEQHADALLALGAQVRVAIGGPAAVPAVAERVGALLLAPDTVLAAAQLSVPTTDGPVPAPGPVGADAHRVRSLAARS